MGNRQKNAPVPEVLTDQSAPKILKKEKYGPKKNLVKLKNHDRIFYVKPEVLIDIYRWTSVKDVNHQPVSSFDGLITYNIKKKILFEFQNSIVAGLKNFQAAMFTTKWMQQLFESHKHYIRNQLGFDDLKLLLMYVSGHFMRGEFKENGSFSYTAAPFINLENMLLNFERKLSQQQKETLTKLRQAGAVVETSHQWFQNQYQRLLQVLHNAPKPLKGRCGKTVTLWRGVAGWISRVKQLQKGDRVPQPTFVSTSLLRSTAMNFMGSKVCCLIEITVNPDQVPFLIIHNTVAELTGIHQEYEVLLAPCFLEIDHIETLVADEFTRREIASHRIYKLGTYLRVRCKAVPYKAVKFQHHCVSLT